MTMQQLLWQGVQELNKAGMPDLERTQGNRIM